MTEPGAYWFLDAPFVQIIGLYSNLLESPGYLQAITKANPIRPNSIGSTKHSHPSPKPSRKRRSSSPCTIPPTAKADIPEVANEQSIDAACAKAGRLARSRPIRHAHNYQRYTRRIAGKQIVYIVVGTGGMPHQAVQTATGQPADTSHQVTYDAAISTYGYLFVTVSAKQLSVQFWQLGAEHNKPFDPLTINLLTHTVT